MYMSICCSEAFGGNTCTKVCRMSEEMLSVTNVVFVGIYSCMYVCASMYRLCISIWYIYMYVEIIFVL